MNTYGLTRSAFLVGLAVIFQLVPVFFSEMFAFVTVLSTFPIYMISRKSMVFGIAGYAAAAMIILLLSPHEGLLFAGTNGIIGLTAGIFMTATNIKTAAAIAAAAFSDFALVFLICFANINLPLPHMNVFILFTVLYLFLAVYCFTTVCISEKLYKKFQLY